MEDLRKELIQVSHNKYSTKTCETILDAVAGAKVKNIDYQRVHYDIRPFGRTMKSVSQKGRPASSGKYWRKVVEILVNI